jgi:asparagine synthase (glutamine-hydrolysing)
MCGIVGVFSNNQSHLELTENILSELIHRGPDAQRIFHENYFTLGHTRLSILDTGERAHQPFMTDLGVLVFNGEIFNFLELKSELEKEFTFFTSSDTEVLFNGLIKYGVDFLERIDGYYSFMFYDKRNKEIFVARDKLGQKPLYFFDMEGSLFISSEIKGFRCLPEIKWEYDEKELLKYLFFQFSKEDKLIKNVYAIPPGSVAKVIKVGSSYELSYLKHFSLLNLFDVDKFNFYKGKSKKYIIEECTKLLKNSVIKRLISDVPIATINSGGLDSSLISAIATAEDKEISMFSLDVLAESEIKFAQRVSEYINNDLSIVTFDEQDFNRYFRETAIALESPMIHPNNVAIFKLAKGISLSKIKVVLSGEMADEFFGGYSFYNDYLNKMFFKNIILKILNIGLVKVIVNKFKTSTGFFNYNRRTPDQLLNIDKQIEIESEYFQEYNSSVQFFNKFMSRSDAKKKALLIFTITNYLPPLLMRGDKLFMMNGIEARMPFDNLELIRFAINMPVKYSKRKFILKLVAEKYLPSDIINRKKIGMPVNYKLNVNKCNGFFSIMSDRLQLELKSAEIFINYMNKEE